MPESQSPLNMYQSHLRDGRLAYQFCLAVAKPFFPPRVVSPFTGTSEFEWRVSNGRGSIYSLSRVTSREEATYAVVLVDVDEGFRMLSRVQLSEDVEIGSRVRVSIEVAANGELAPFFVLERSE